MAADDAHFERRLAALEARLAQQEAENRRLRGMVRRDTPMAWLVALFVVLGGLAFAGGILPAIAQNGTGDEKPIGVATSGSPVILGWQSLPTNASDTTAIINPSSDTLMQTTFYAGNWTNSMIPLPGNYRAAILGFTAGSDISSGTPRIGVFGAVDQNGFGVYGSNQGTGTGIRGDSTSGYGGQFSGGLAQLRLVPGATLGPPAGSSHQTGELYVDSAGNLYLCTTGGATPKWAKLNLSAGYVPMIVSP